MLKRFVIERDIPNIGGMSDGELGNAANTSNGALAKIAGLQWEHSYVTQDKTFCIYLAESEELIHRHAELSGFPVSRVTEVTRIIDPTTEQYCSLVTTGPADAAKDMAAQGRD